MELFIDDSGDLNGFTFKGRGSAIGPARSWCIPYTVPFPMSKRYCGSRESGGVRSRTETRGGRGRQTAWRGVSVSVSCYSSAFMTGSSSLYVSSHSSGFMNGSSSVYSSELQTRSENRPGPFLRVQQIRVSMGPQRSVGTSMSACIVFCILRALSSFLCHSMRFAQGSDAMPLFDKTRDGTYQLLTARQLEQPTLGRLA
jgi:hypothetical protein